MTCPECGAEVDPDDEYCSNCGHELGLEEEEPDEEPQDGDAEKDLSWWEKMRNSVKRKTPLFISGTTPDQDIWLDTETWQLMSEEEALEELSARCGSCGRDFSLDKEEDADEVCGFCNRKLSDIKNAVAPLFGIQQEKKKK